MIKKFKESLSKLEMTQLNIKWIRDPEDKLLQDVYYNVLVELFPKTDDLDSLENIKYYLKEFDGKTKYKPIYIVLALLKDEVVIGASVFGLFSNNSFCFVKGEYTGIIREERKHGAFDKLLQGRENILKREVAKLGFNSLDFILNELESPLKVSSRKRDVLKTIRLWRLKGFRKVDFNFVQLPLNNDKNSISYFDLYIKPLTEELFQKTSFSHLEMAIIVEACQTFRVSDRAPENYIEYQEMIKEIKKRGRINICRN